MVIWGLTGQHLVRSSFYPSGAGRKWVKKTQKMQKIKKGPTDVAETFRMSQLGSLELKFKSGQMANFWTDTELQAQGVDIGIKEK